MDLDKILAQLRLERDLIDQAIANLEWLAKGPRPAPGSPPGRANQNRPQGQAGARRTGVD